MFDFPRKPLTRALLLGGRVMQRAYPVRLPTSLDAEVREFAAANGLTVNRALAELVALALIGNAGRGSA